MRPGASHQTTTWWNVWRAKHPARCRVSNMLFAPALCRDISVAVIFAHLTMASKGGRCGGHRCFEPTLAVGRVYPQWDRAPRGHAGWDNNRTTLAAWLSPERWSEFRVAPTGHALLTLGQPLGWKSTVTDAWGASCTCSRAAASSWRPRLPPRLSSASEPARAQAPTVDGRNLAPL